MIVLTMLLAMAVPEEMTLPPKVEGKVTASLSVRIAEQTPIQGSARVRLRFTVDGPADLFVEGPSLEDALAAWRGVTLRTGSYRPDEPARWECTLELVQIKPGVVPLPGVRILVHSGGTTHTITWPELLHESADVSPVVEVEPAPPSPWPERLRWGGLLILMLACGTGVVFSVRRLVARPVLALPPLAAALAAIDSVSESQDEPMGLVARLDGILRAYLETRGVAATRMTGAELSVHLGPIPRGDEFAAVLAQGEESKFSGMGVTRTQVQELVSRARLLLTSLEKEGGQG